MKIILLHIGKHKTGTSSFQSMLGDKQESLSEFGFCVLPTKLCSRIAAAAIRDKLPIPPRRWFKQEDTILENLEHEVSQFLMDKEYDTLIVSSEHYSYFRTSDEIDKLRQVLPKESRFFVFLVTRDLEDFRISYRKQIIKTGHGTSDDRSSPYYCEKDSWLLDDEKIINLWKDELLNLTVLEYSKHGMVQKLGASMQLPKAILNEEYRKNVSPKIWGYANGIAKKVMRKLPFYRTLTAILKRKGGTR